MSRAQNSKKQPLSRERIEAAALGVIEREGMAGFSTRKLASDLGCEAMSIYHYFPSRGHLMDALVDRVIAEMPPIPAPGPTWEERARRLSADWRRVMTSRPSFFVFLATHRLNTRRSLAWLNGVLAFFGEVGLCEEEAVRLFRAFGYYMMGAGLDETAGYARGPSTVEPLSEDELRQEFPAVASAGRFFGAGEQDKTFELGLDLLFNGIDALVARRSAARDARTPYAVDGA